MIAAHHVAQALRLAVAVAIAAALMIAALASASAAAPAQKASPFGSTAAILKWINDYRHQPDPDGLPTAVRALSDMTLFAHQR